jgi:nitrogen fixation/metabolism regulation signal transduction histidine kinase
MKTEKLYAPPPLFPRNKIQQFDDFFRQNPLLKPTRPGICKNKTNLRPLTNFYRMNVDNFRLNLAFRIISLVLSIFIFALVLNKNGYIFTSVFLGLLIIYQSISLLQYVESANNEMIKLLNYIRYDDFSNTYYFKIKGKSFSRLSEALNSVMAQFKDLRAEKEAQYLYLQNIIQHIGVGIISFSKTGDIHIINNAAKQLFKKINLVNIKNLNGISPELVQTCLTLKSGSRKLIRVKLDEFTYELAVHALDISLRGDEYKVVSIQNIHSELEDKEMDAWQNIVRVLTHEIMNSVAPISSLAATIQDEIRAAKEENKKISDEEAEDLIYAAGTIERRSESLINFVRDFRMLTQIREPLLKQVQVKKLFEHIVSLMKISADDAKVRLNVQLPPASMYIAADEVLIEQVLINLVKNAVEAHKDCEKETKFVEMFALYDTKSRPMIVVKDNAGGIESEALEKIFIPFYSTKKGGSGIGLSLSRQIMRMHKGNILASSEIGIGTSFVLKF